MGNNVIIIGGGIAGLAAGVFCRLNDLSPVIFEKHQIPGGLCTGWKRRGYTFDGCIHYVYGSGEDRFMNRLMKTMGAVGTLQYLHHDIFTSVETSCGKTVHFYTDITKLEAHLLNISPEDEKQIRTLVRVVRSMSKAALPVSAPARLGEWFEMLKALIAFVPHYASWKKVSVRKFAEGFKSPALKEAFMRYYGYADLPDLPVCFLMINMAQLNVQNAGWPIGGSLALAREVENRYLSLGGTIHYNACVKKILVRNGTACGVLLEDGTEHHADIVISAADGYKTLYGMLEGKYTPRELENAYQTEKVIPSLVQVSFGVARDFSNMPHALTLCLKQPVKVMGKCHFTLHLTHFCFDKSMSPEGKSSVVVNFETDYDIWKELSKSKEAYAKAKAGVASQVIEVLDKRFPGFKNQIEVIDIATPVTYERYTDNWQGSPQGWQTLVGNQSNFSNTLPGLQNFYMTGQWVQRGGGIPGGAVSAFNTVKQIVKTHRNLLKTQAAVGKKLLNEEPT